MRHWEKENKWERQTLRLVQAEFPCFLLGSPAFLSLGFLHVFTSHKKSLSVDQQPAPETLVVFIHFLDLEITFWFSSFSTSNIISRVPCLPHMWRSKTLTKIEELNGSHILCSRGRWSRGNYQTFPSCASKCMTNSFCFSSVHTFPFPVCQ